MIGETLGHYRVVSEIGHGGMGVVYRAEHELIGRKAAVKLLLPELSKNTELVERFFNEARVAGMTNHPGLAEVFDFGHHADGSAYIVMELLEGESLAKRMSSKSMTVTTALAITRQVASALHAAHEQGVVHRDLKPENIFLIRDPDAPSQLRTKVLDFGIAKLERAEEPRSVKTKTGTVFGTPRYMAPEQCKNASTVDRRADIYALGCILHEMVLGVAPFDYDNWGELVAAHIHETPKRPRSRDPGLPKDVEALILRAIAKHPDDRFATMHDLAQCAEAAWRASTNQPNPLFTPPRGMRPYKKADESAPTVFASGRARKARRTPWLPIALAAVVAAGVLVVIALRDPDADADPMAVVDAGLARMELPDATTIRVTSIDTDAAADSEVTLEIDSNPKSVVYRVTGGVKVKLGETPLQTSYPRTPGGTVDFVLLRPGYRDHPITFSTDRSDKKHVKLEKIARVPHDRCAHLKSDPNRYALCTNPPKPPTDRCAHLKADTNAYSRCVNQQ